MRFDCIRVVVGLLVGLAFSWASGVTASNLEMTRDLWIEGQAHTAHLEASHVNSVSQSGDNVHYKGFFPDYPESWIRVSLTERGWQGIAQLDGRLHTIRSGGSEEPVKSYSFSHQEAPQCGMDHMHGDAAITMNSMESDAAVEAISDRYSELCAERVDGACLMLELELAFDQQFQARYPSDFRTRAGAILNMVEGFYEAQFGIVFDTLTLTYMDSQLFSTTTNAGDLLDDIATKRRNGDVPFLKSGRSIFHFVTGRRFQDGIAGVAYLSTLCEGGGFASGVSHALDDETLMAVVVAHEIGHNFGAVHDNLDNNNCPSGLNIMSPTVQASYDSFSTCSVDDMTDTISALSNVEQCFNFPADAGISEVDGNPSEVPAGESFQSFYDVSYADASQPAEGLAVEGSIGSNEGQFQSVTLNGAACELLSDTRFRCRGAQTPDSQRLAIEGTTGTATSLNLVQGVALISGSGEVKDIRPANDTAMDQIIVAGGTEPPSDREEFNEDVESDAPAPSGSSGSGGSSGGGGALGWFWLLLALPAVARRSLRFR